MYSEELENDPICYGNTIYILHKESRRFFSVGGYKSPTTGNKEGKFIIIKVLLSSIILFQKINL